MPKKIDHDSYRKELATKAASLFSEYGYTGLGMRKIASELGISKSALYHYFPTKQALFHACTDIVTRFDEDSQSDSLMETMREAPLEQRVQVLMSIIKEMEPSFPSEMSLLLDYLRGRTKQDIADDPTMQLANKRYDALFEQFFDKEDAKPVYCLMLGTLLLRFFDGGTTEFDEIEDWLLENLKEKVVYKKATLE